MIKNNKQPLIYDCKFCTNSYASSRSVSNHIKLCKTKLTLDNKIIDLENKNIEHVKKIKKQELMITRLNKNIKELELERYINLKQDKTNLTQDNNNLANIAVTTSQTAKTLTMSALTYFQTYYKDVPNLKPIVDYSTMKDEFKTDTEFAQHLISEYQNSHISDYLGQYFIDRYKKKDPRFQAMWNSDVDRVVYIIRWLLTDNTIAWIPDKKGIVIREQIIRPGLDYVKNILKQFAQDCGKKHIEAHADDYGVNDQLEIMNTQKLTNEILSLIDNRVLEKDILKQISPAFFWKKQFISDQLQITNETKKSTSGVKVEEIKDETIKSTSGVKVEEFKDDEVDNEDVEVDNDEVDIDNVNNGNKVDELDEDEINEYESESESESDEDDKKEVNVQKLLQKTTIKNVNKDKKVQAIKEINKINEVKEETKVETKVKHIIKPHIAEYERRCALNNNSKNAKEIHLKNLKKVRERYIQGDSDEDIEEYTKPKEKPKIKNTRVDSDEEDIKPKEKPKIKNTRVDSDEEDTKPKIKNTRVDSDEEDTKPKIKNTRNDLDEEDKKPKEKKIPKSSNPPNKLKVFIKK
jgi:hypothetical protein